MVDINLFKEDEEEEKSNWESPSEENVNQDAPEDLELTDEILESEESGEENILNDTDGAKEFEAPEEKEPEDDYGFGDVRKKRTSVWLWVFFGIVVAAVVLYLFVYWPAQQRKKIVVPTVKRPALGQVKPDSAAGVAAGQDSSSLKHVASMIDESAVGSLIPRKTLSAATKSILADLSRVEQFGTFLITGDRFFVEYVSATPNVSQAMGQKIKTLLSVNAVTASPEDRHRTGGNIHYWGVISGRFPNASRTSQNISYERYKTPEAFITGIQDLIRKNGLAVKAVQKLSKTTDASAKKTLVRVICDGSQRNAVALLTALEEFEINGSLFKLLLAPVNYSDFKADPVKLVIDFYVYSSQAV